MSQGIKIDQLASEIEKQLTDYKDLAADELKKAVKKAGKTVKDEINGSAPVRTGRYAKSWTSKVTADMTLYARWIPPAGSLAKLVYRLFYFLCSSKSGQ